MYDTGTYQDYDKEFAGLYTQVTARKAIDYATPYGGVAIPVSLISTHPSVVRPTQAIAVPRGQKDYIMSLYTFAQSSLVDAMVDEAQRNASTVFLCPFDGVKPQPLNQSWTIDQHLTFGKGKKSSAELWDVYQGKIYYEFETLQGARIRLTGAGNVINIQLITPDGVEVFSFAGNHPSVLNQATADGIEITCQNYTLYNGTEASAAYQTNGMMYGANTHIKIYINEKFNTGEVDEYIPLGGSDAYPLLTEAANSSVTVGYTTQGAYAACNMRLTGGVWVGNDLSRLENDTLYFFIRNTVGYAGSHSGYYVDIQNGKATLYYQDYSHNVYPAPQPIERDSTTYEPNTPIWRILLNIRSLSSVNNVDSDYRRLTGAWTQPMPAGGRLIIGFSPIYPRLDEETRFTNFCDQAGQTSADIMLYPYWSDGIPDGIQPIRNDVKENYYRKIQRLYLKNHESLCSLTQLLMDESLYKGTRNWQTGEPMTLNNPYLISLKSGRGNKRDSQLISAYTAGVLTSCSAYKSASGHIYHGGASLKLYAQNEIKDMHRYGVMTYHLQDGVKMIYIDRSAYVKSKADAATSIFEKVYERNKSVRTINLFTYTASRMFYQHYFNKALEGSIQLMIQGDIAAILQEMAKQGAVEHPDGDDVAVKSIDAESYSAVVQMQIKGTPEKLYVKIGV